MGSFTQLTYHVVFGTKYRRPFITKSLREPLYEYVGGIIRAKHGQLLEIGGIEDHIYMLVNLAASVAVSDSVRDIKANSSRWVNDRPDQSMPFEWQKGYGAFTVSYSQVDVVRRYIEKQQEHHRKKTFQEEYVELLERHGIPYEQQYLFEGEPAG